MKTKKMKFISILVCSFLIVSCAGNTRSTVPSDDTFSTEYVPSRTEAVMEGAQKYCLSKGKNIEVIKTDCPWRCVTTFQCVVKEKIEQ